MRSIFSSPTSSKENVIHLIDYVIVSPKFFYIEQFILQLSMATYFRT